MTQQRQRRIDPRLLVPGLGVMVVLLAALTVFLLSGGGDDTPETALATGGGPVSITEGDSTAAASTPAASVQDTGRQAFATIVQERSVAFEPTQGERRNSAQTQIVAAGVPAAGQDIRAFAWQDQDGHVLAAILEGESVAGRVCGVSVSLLDGAAHLDGSVDVKARPDCDAPGFYQSPITSAHEPGASSGDPLFHVVRSSAPLPDGAEVHIWAFVAVGDQWDNVGFTCDQECTQELTGYGDPTTPEDFEREREYLERQREALVFISEWMEEVVRTQGEQGYEITEDGWAAALALQGVLIPLAPPSAQ